MERKGGRRPRSGVVEMLAGERLNTGGDATEHDHDDRVIST
jgi:hypothetical protein